MSIFKSKQLPTVAEPTFSNQGSNPYSAQQLANAQQQQNAAVASPNPWVSTGVNLGQPPYVSGQAISIAPAHSRVIIDVVANGFTIACGGQIYVAADIDELAGVVRAALVTAKLIG